MAQRNARIDLALQKAVEAHPELVEGPDLAEMFAAGVVMREDGTLLDSVAKLAARAGDPQAMADVERALPKDGGLTFNANFPQHATDAGRPRAARPDATACSHRQPGITT